MRLFHTVSMLLFFGLLGAPVRALAQTGAPTTALPRGDVSVSVGLFSAKEDRPNSDDNWYPSWNGGLSAGYYWTEHLKTEIDAGLTSEGNVWGPYGSPADIRYGGANHKFSTRAVAIGQQYQFGHNARFHPHVGAGVAVEWVRHTEERQPIYQTLRAPPYAVIIVPARTIGPTTDLRTVPFVAGGFKGYLSERAFFRSDLRVGFGGEVKHVTLKCGFGFDF